ncbi:MAG TPA: N-6 DNA methylase [Pseudonocardiaceae bacterium]|nr:N-6 DNA methylase [Pseudonocardiaceae bacterium]
MESAAGWGALPAEPEVLDRDLADLIIELGGELGPAEAFEFLCARYQEAHSRRLFTTPPDTAALLLDLVGRPDTVLDPACGLGTLLVGGTVLGQELNATSATIAAVRLLLAGRDATVVAGDSLRADGLAGRLADAVVCDPPFNERAWGYQELTSDPRWEYGLPPRGESELAWVQHCLAHTRPGGMAAVLMPPAAAARRPGKRIRGNLLRAGALRAVISLATGGPDLWLLRRPEPGDRPPSHVLLTSDEDARASWHRFLDDPTTATRIIDVLDDDVDVSPARHRPAHHGEELVRELAAATRTLRELDLRPPEFATPGEPRPTTSVGELAKAGLLTVQHAPARMTIDDGDVPVLTADDLAANRPPSGRTTADDGLVEIAEGDVVASVLGTARVMTTGGAVLGPYLSRYRVDPERLDPDFLAGVLRAAQPTHPGSSRIDARRTQVPRMSLAEQRAYGAAFRQLGRLEDTLRTATAAGETLVRLGFDGLVAGHLRPAD